MRLRRDAGVLLFGLACAWPSAADARAEALPPAAPAAPQVLHSRAPTPPLCEVPRLVVAPAVPFIRAEGAAPDTTPPVFASFPTVDPEGIHSVSFAWDPATDPESGISQYAFAVGSTPGAGDLRWWQLVNLDLRWYFSPGPIGVSEGDTFYVSIRAYNGEGLSTDVSSGPQTLVYETIGDPSYVMEVAFPDWGFDLDGHLTTGWTPAEIAPMQDFVDKMVPIIKQAYGPPSRSYTVKIVKDLRYSSTNVFFPSLNEIHTDGFLPQLMTHELLHAFRDNVLITMNANWQYDAELSGFEESFAQGMSYECMNRFAAQYPGHPAAPGLYGSSEGWDYDFNNDRALTSTTFWSAGGGTGLAYQRYEVGAAAIAKMLLEDADFAGRFATEYYARLDADRDLRPSRALVRDVLGHALNTVEGLDTENWIDRQRIFDCVIQPGRKIWVKTQHYPWTEYLAFQTLYYYETMSCGSEWACWNGMEWVYHGLNGSRGYGTLHDGAGAVVWQDSLLIEPVENPPEHFGFGSERKSLSTDDDLDPWPLGDPDDYVLGLHAFGLYTFDLSFEGDKTSVHRVMGDTLRATRGVFGGVLNGNGGRIYLQHENHPSEPPLDVVDGAFWGERAWASIPNPNTGQLDSEPGRVSVVYVDADSNAWTAKRNIGYGSFRGNQVFLFDVDDMTPVAGLSVGAAVSGRLELGAPFPNPGSASSSIRYRAERGQRVRLRVFDIQGRVVRTLVDGQALGGWATVRWDGLNDGGTRVGAGVYLYRLESGGRAVIRKAVRTR